MWAAQYYRVEKPFQWITSGGLGTMGFAVPAAIGAKVGVGRETPVVAIDGDGCFQMTFQELATAVQHDIPVVFCVINNGYLGMVRQWQEMFFDGNLVAVSLRGPDWVKLAEAYGIKGWRCGDPAELEDGLATLLGEPGPGLLHCRVPAEEKVLPMVPAGEPLARIIVSW